MPCLIIDAMLNDCELVMKYDAMDFSLYWLRLLWLVAWRQQVIAGTSVSLISHIPDSRVHGANMGPTWVLSAPDGPHVGPMNLAIEESIKNSEFCFYKYWQMLFALRGPYY